MRGDTLYRGRLFKVCAEIVGEHRGGTIVMDIGRVARPLRRRSWTVEAAQEALAYLVEHPDTVAAGPDGTEAIFNQAKVEMEITKQ